MRGIIKMHPLSPPLAHTLKHTHTNGGKLNCCIRKLYNQFNQVNRCKIIEQWQPFKLLIYTQALDALDNL